MKERKIIHGYGHATFPNIFKEGRIGKFRTRNRCKYAACSISNYNTRQGFLTQRELNRDEVIARTGAAILTNQGVYPDRTGEGKAYPGQLACYDDRFIPGLREIAQLWRQTAGEGTVLLAQILHGGRYGGLGIDHYWQPSADIPRMMHFSAADQGTPVCVEITKDDMARCIEDHANAARRLVQAGFDGMEITCFVGYLISNFLSRYTNKRTDEYGGTVENRARFMIQMIQAIRKAVGDHIIVGVRLNSDELLPGGNSREECLEIMKIAQDEGGVDFISAVVAWHESPEGSWGREKRPDHFLYSLENIKRKVDVPICFGPQLRDPFVAEKALAEGLLDYWEMCRPFLADPDILNKTARHDVKAIRYCINCLWCGAKFLRGQPYICAVNPLLGHEKDPDFQPHPVLWPKKVMVIGGGAAGCAAALETSKRGHRVALFDRNDRLGGQLLAAGGDTYGGFSYMYLVQWYEEMLRREGIEVHLNTEVTPEVITDFWPDVAILATGARIKIPAIPGATNDNVFSAYDVLKAKIEIKGEKVAILGTTTVGFAVGHRLHDAGKEVTFIEKGPVEFRRDVTHNYAWRYRVWFKTVKGKGVSSITDADPFEITEKAVKVRLKSGQEETVVADSVVFVDRVSEQGLMDFLTPNVDVIEIVGDVIRPRYIYTAVHEGFKAGRRV